MQPPVEIRYAGVVIGRAETVLAEEGEADRLFLSFADPLPVGSLLELRSADTRAQARVESVIEVAEGSGMKVRLLPGRETGAHAVVDDAPPARPVASEPVSDGVPQLVVGSGPDSGEASTAIETSGAIDAGADANGAGKKKRRRRR